MSEAPPTQFSLLLAQAQQGRVEAMDELIRLVYQDLRRLAQNYLKQERPSPSLQATALVHEVYVRLFSAKPIEWQNRSHFLVVAARQMRRLLIDHARTAKAAKHNGSRAALEEAALLPRLNDPDLVALDEALQALEKLRPKAGQVVELRFFAGLTEAEIARVLGLSVTTIKREWKFAKAWLYDELQRRAPQGPTKVADRSAS
jgi:RNA polymerase sigma-70 factor, ECF subfamily